MDTVVDTEETSYLWGAVVQRFREQLLGAESLEIPDGYDFHDNEGRYAEPNLMQRLVAYRLLTEKRLGNWSGTGAAKTLSAILGSRVIGAKLTLVVAPNNVVPTWQKAIMNDFPDSDVIVKDRGPLTIDPDRFTYLVYKYESNGPSERPPAERQSEHLSAPWPAPSPCVTTICATRRRSIGSAGRPDARGASTR